MRISRAQNVPNNTGANYRKQKISLGKTAKRSDPISADPCRQQGERVREEITSNKCCAVQVRGKRGGDRKGSQVQSKKPKKGSEKGGAVSANVAGQARGGQKGKPGAE